jgi:hypothetical protein
MTAILTLHQLNTPVVDIHQDGCQQADAQVTQHHDRNDLDRRAGLVKNGPNTGWSRAAP